MSRENLLIALTPFVLSTDDNEAIYMLEVNTEFSQDSDDLEAICEGLEVAVYDTAGTLDPKAATTPAIEPVAGSNRYALVTYHPEQGLGAGTYPIIVTVQQADAIELDAGDIADNTVSEVAVCSTYTVPA